MLIVKTVHKYIDRPDEFDKEVNALLAEGYELREFHTNARGSLIALMIKNDDSKSRAQWVIKRHLVNGKSEIRCSNCGYKMTTFGTPSACPSCHVKMDLWEK